MDMTKAALLPILWIAAGGSLAHGAEQGWSAVRAQRRTPTGEGRPSRPSSKSSNVEAMAEAATTHDLLPSGDVRFLVSGGRGGAGMSVGVAGGVRGLG
jgi:hypothetical protein